MPDTPPLPENRYSIIYADPPWSYNDKAVGYGGMVAHYAGMSLEDICALPVASIAAGDSMLFLWTTMPHLPAALQVIDNWGFAYRTMAFVWVKRNRKDDRLTDAQAVFPFKWASDAKRWFWGLGHWTRSNAELCLLGIKGRPKRASAKVHSIIDTPLEGHSRKPSVVRERIVELCGDLPRIELFARERVNGWTAWGLGVDAPGPLFEGGK